MYLRTGWTGFHFTPPVPTNLKTGYVRYLDDVEVGGQTGAYVATMNYFNDNYFAYSSNGTDWTVPRLVNASHPWPPREDLRLGEVRDDLCVAPGEPVIVSDPYGHVAGTEVEILTSEGYTGVNTAPRSKCSPHAVLDPNPCYSPLEDQMRGSTWGIYKMSGTFSTSQSLDRQNVSVDGQSIFYVEDGIRYQYDCVDSTCTEAESFLLFNDFDPHAYVTVSAQVMAEIELTYPLSTSMRPGRYSILERNVSAQPLEWWWVTATSLFSYASEAHFLSCNRNDPTAFVAISTAQRDKLVADYGPDYEGPRRCLTVDK